MSKETLDRENGQESAVRHRESASSPNRKSDTKVPIVAIGASAGGLESIERFFQNIEEKTGAAFIVVQHLSPDFKSFMPRILSKKTRLQVLTATDQMPVHPDTIYLMPPRMHLVIEDNILYLTDIQRTRVPNKPVDMFFESLALDNGKNATAVVLSGTGSDGAEGIVRIHDAGGKVYVESPASAKFDGMPGAAIAKRIHDGEGTPFEIAGEIFGKNIVDLHSSTLILEKELAGSDERVHIFKAIENRYGVDFARYKIATVNRRIDRRMTELNLTDIGGYWNYIQENEAEVSTLYYEMLIGVTKFFRDPEAFKLIKSQIANMVQKKSSGEEVRVWSAGCASGEETYSLAILFSEEIRRSGKTLHLKVFATDIDDEILGRAAAGMYRKEQLRDMPERYRNKYFAEKIDVYKVDTELRSKVVFARHNIMNDPPFTKLDMITCRNLLIYLDNDTQRQLLSLFYFSLNSSGTLFLGPSESLGKYEAGYTAIDAKWKIFSKSADTLPAVGKLKLTSQRKEPDFPVIVNTPQRPASVTANTAVRFSADNAYRALLDQYVPPGLLIDEMQDLLHVYGKLPFPLSFKPGKMSSSLRSFLDESLCTAISVCVQRVKREKIPVEYSNFVIHDEVEDKALDFQVLPVAQPDSDHITHFLVTFGSDGYKHLDDIEARVVIGNSVNLEQVSALQQELKNTKQHLQATVEELESTNEELQSTNEELLASNEELQSTNEEVHSVNEELYTVNAEYQTKITELNQLSIDEEHLFSSTGVGTIFIDQERHIRKFTPAAAELFNLMSQDHGRPFDHVTHQFEGVNFNQLVEQCIGTQENVESEVQTQNGEPYLVKIIPYCDDRDQLDGVVISFVSVQAVKRAEQQYRDMFQSSPVGIAGIKPDHSIESANASLIKLLGYSVDELLGLPLTQLFAESEESTAAGVIEAYVDGAADNNESEQVASTILTKDGMKVPVEISVNSVPTADGVLIHLYVTDMTDRQKLLDTVERHRDELEAQVEARTTELCVRTREYEDLYENAPDMYASIDPESATITKCNNRLAMITGYDKSELIGMKVFDLYHPDSHLDAQAAFEQFVDTGKVKSRHLKLRMKSGAQLHVLLNVDAVRDEEGNILQSRSTWVDISDVQLLREENRTFLLATKGSDIGIWDWDFKSGDQNWSDKFHELLGYSEASTAGLSFEMPDIIHPNDRQALTKLFKSHFSGKSTFDIESRLKTQSGEYLWFRLQGRAVRVAGKVERMVGSAQNVHAAREAKDELNRQAEIHRFITHETNDGWWDWHTQDDFEYMSPRFWEAFGIDPSTRSNSPSEWKDVIHPDDLVLSMENFRKHAESGGEYPYVQEVRYRHSEGHWVTVICRGRVVEWDNQGLPKRMVGVHTDITKLKQQEDQLKEINAQLAKSNEDLERFAYITSHDLKAPLRGISTLVGFMEEDLCGLLDDNSEEAESIKANLARLARQANRMEGLITGVLDYSRVDSAGAGVESIRVGELLTDLAIDHQLEVGRQFVMPDNLPTIKTDPVMFEQVFGNLMSNAAKFHPYPEELKIVVGCEQAGENYVFSVQDNGPGIHPDYHARIFDMFQTLQSRDTYESTGIGLTLVKRIVEKFGGEIRIESKEGEGAKFLFSWPAVVRMPAI